MKKDKKQKKTGWIIAGILLAVVLIAGIGAFAYMRSIVGKVNTVEVNTDNLAAVNNQDVITIALYGIDLGGGTTDSGRSDTIMILTIDPNRRSIRLCSIMRDSFVNIEEYGMDKINHAYAYGGPELAMKTLNQNFGLNVTHFASVDFDSLAEIIDMLGGVDVEITEEEIATGSIPGITSPGKQTLNGEQAVRYARIRHTWGDDYRRTQRQRNVINQMMIKAMQLPVSEWPGLIGEIAPLITTNYTTNEIIDLAAKYGSYAKKGIKETRFPIDGECEGVYLNDIYYLTFDIPSMAQKIQDFVYHDIMP